MANAPAPAPNQPNMFDLSGGGLHITYTTTSFGGQPQFTYHDAHKNLSFSGNQIRTVAVPDLGTIVSVTLMMTVDSGSTSFSLLIPRVNIPGNQSVPISTDGVTTIHRFSIIPALNNGQRDFYTVTRLTGTAQHVVFLAGGGGANKAS